MNVKLAFRVGGLLVAAGAVAIVVLAQKRRADDPHQLTAHAKGIEWAMAPLSAPFYAPEGATPCETAYIGFVAAQDASKNSGRAPLFTKLADHDEFMALCNQLPNQAQICMQARYIANHRDECARVRPPQTTLDAMFQVREAPNPVPKE